MTHRLPHLVLAAGIVTCLGMIGYWMLFSHFATYDDEGYIILSAQAYFSQGRLYDLVYSQYGPAFYAVMDAVQNLQGAPIDHTSARWLTLGFWLGTALACAALIWRETTSRTLGIFTLAATFLYLYFLPDEPFHPGSFIVFLLALTTWLLCELIRAGKWTNAALLAGSTSAILLLTKINVGVFHLVAIGAWALGHARATRLRHASAFATSLALPAIAAAVMHALIAESWVHTYLLVFTVGAITLACTMHGEALIDRRHLGAFLAAGTLTGSSILAAIWLRGTSLHGLLQGVFLGPLQHPGNYSYPVDWRPGTVPLAVLSLTLALLLPWLRRTYSEAVADRIVIVLRLLQTAALLVGLMLLMQGRVIGAVFSYVAPLLWTWVVPLGGGDDAKHRLASRSLLATILLLQYLHAYPVGGSQESWGTFLFMPLVALGLGDLRRLGPAGARWPAWRWIAGPLGVALLVKVAWVATETRRKHAGRMDLALPGAKHLRLEENLRAAYRILCLNASVHADQLFSLPGLYSFNLWTGLPPPTARNTTLWFTLLTEVEQRAIIEAVERAPRTCIIVQETLVELMQANKVAIRGPLRDYIYQNFALAFRLEGFAFLVRTGRTCAPLGIARLEAISPVEQQAPQFDSRIEFTIVGDGTPIAAIAAVQTSGKLQPGLILNADNTRVVTTAVQSAGHALRPPEIASWPLRSTGLTHVSISYDSRSLTASMGAGTVLYLQDFTGQSHQEVAVLSAP